MQVSQTQPSYSISESSKRINYLEAAIEGGAVGVYLCSDIVDFSSAIISRLKADEKDILSKKRVIISSLSLVGSVAYCANWAGRVQLLSLGAFSPLVAWIGYVSGLFLSSAKIADDIWDFNHQAEKFQTGSTREKQIACQMQTADLLRMVARITIIVWTIISMVLLCTHLPALSLIQTPLLCISSLISFIEMIYKVSIKHEKKPALV